uniref:Putative LOC101744334 [Bombyx mori] n=1 Tax=Lepeophtheirus salmonis TaxID=72036 RepID=A0A0K2V5J5_LEPSM
MASKSMILMLKNKIQKIDELLTEVSDKDEELARNRIEIAQLREIISHNDVSSIHELQNKIRQYETQSSHQLKEIHQLKSSRISDLASKNEEIHNLCAEVSSLKTQNGNKSQEISNLKAGRNEINVLKSEISILREELKRITNENSILKSSQLEIKKLESNISSLSNEIERKNTKIIDLESELGSSSLLMSSNSRMKVKNGKPFDMDFIQNINKKLILLRSKMSLVLEESRSQTTKQSAMNEEKLSWNLNELNGELSSINDKAAKINTMMTSLMDVDGETEASILKLKNQNKDLNMKLKHEISRSNELNAKLISLNRRVKYSLQSRSPSELVCVSVQTDNIPPRVLSPSLKVKKTIIEEATSSFTPNVKVSFLPGAFQKRKIMLITKKSPIMTDDLPPMLHTNYLFSNFSCSESTSKDKINSILEKRIDERSSSLKNRVSLFKASRKEKVNNLFSCSSSSDGEPSPKKSKNASNLTPLGKSSFKRAEISVNRTKLSEIDKKKLLQKTVKPAQSPHAIRTTRSFGRLPPSLIGPNQSASETSNLKSSNVFKKSPTKSETNIIYSSNYSNKDTVTTKTNIQSNSSSMSSDEVAIETSFSNYSENEEEDVPLTIDLNYYDEDPNQIKTNHRVIHSSNNRRSSEDKSNSITHSTEPEKFNSTKDIVSEGLSKGENYEQPIALLLPPPPQSDDDTFIIKGPLKMANTQSNSSELFQDDKSYLQRMSLIYEKERISKAEELQKRELALNVAINRESIIKLIEEQLHRYSKIVLVFQLSCFFFRLWKSITKETFEDIVNKISQEGFLHSSPRILIDILYVAVKAEKSSAFSEPPQPHMLGSPVLTIKQKKIIALIHALDEKSEFSGFIGNEFIQYLYYSLIGKGRMAQVLKLFEVLNLVRIYISLARLKGQEERVKTFMYDVTFFNNSRMHAIIYNIVLTWPDLFTWTGDGGGESADPILEATVWIIYNTGPATGASDFKVHDCRRSLQSRCGLISPYSTGIELVQKLIQRVTSEPSNRILKHSTVKAFLIISKSKDYKWCTNNLVNPLLQLLSEENSNYFHKSGGLMPWVVESIGEISRIYPADERTHLEDVFNPIKSLLENHDINPLLETACIKCLIRLGHHLQYQSVKFLSSWSPKFPIDDEIQILIQNFLGTRAHEFVHKQMKFARPALNPSKKRKRI